MRRSLAAAGALVFLGAASLAVPAGAGTLQDGDTGKTARGLSLAENAHFGAHRRYCRRWRHECAYRWGWGTWRFRRCLRNHGCW